jgi:metal-sulfur cluster biosynthetic enzyme
VTSVISKDDVLRSLNDIVDPCSIAMGAPAGLVDMGMVYDVDICEMPGGARVDVQLLLTEAGCLMAAPFGVRAEESLAQLPGVAQVRVSVTTAVEWTEERISPSLRAELARVRTERRARVVPRAASR